MAEPQEQAPWARLPEQAHQEGVPGLLQTSLRGTEQDLLSSAGVMEPEPASGEVDWCTLFLW